jgi:hypothetical protein
MVPRPRIRLFLQSLAFLSGRAKEARKKLRSSTNRVIGRYKTNGRAMSRKSFVIRDQLEKFLPLPGPAP